HGFQHRLARQLRVVEQVMADEGRVDAMHQWIVDLKIAQNLDSPLAHFCGGTAAHQCPQRTTVTVRTERDAMLLGEQDSAVRIDRRHQALTETEYLIRTEAEVIVLLEERQRGLVID